MNDLRVAAVRMRSGYGQVESNLARTEHFVRSAAEQGADVVCFPEMNVTGYALREDIQELAEPAPGPSTLRLRQMADEHGITVIAGLAERTESGGTAITQVIASPGSEIGRYRKIHLSPGEQAIFEAGERPEVFEAKGTRLGLQLCYDAHFPELSTLLALAGAEVLFVSHASPAPETAKDKRDRWLRYLPARAYDNSVFVVACNQVGNGEAGIRFSGVILILDPRGEVVAESHGDDEDMLVADLRAEDLAKTRGTRMGFFLAHRRPGLYGGLADRTGDARFARPRPGLDLCEEEAPESAGCTRAASAI